MLESGSSGSVRGASSNGRPYREPRPSAVMVGLAAAAYRPVLNLVNGSPNAPVSISQARR